MRSFITTLILLVAVISAVLVTVPRLVDWNDYRGLLTSQAEEMTGAAVAIDGRIDFSLLPTPTLSLARTRFTGGDGASVRFGLGIDRIDLRLRALPLLRGEVRIGDIRLVRPVLEVHNSPDQDVSRHGGDPLLELIAFRPDRLTVVDGRAVLREGSAAGRHFESIDVEVVAGSADGPFALQGAFEAGDRQFDLDAQTGRLSPDQVSTLQLRISVLGRQPARLHYNGAVWWDADNPRLRGEVSVVGYDTGSVAALVGDALGHALPRPPSWLDSPFEISGRLQLDRESLQLDELRLQLADTPAAGQLRLAFGPNPTMMLRLQVERIELSDALAPRPADLAPLADLSTALDGEIHLSVAALHYRDRSADRVRLRLTLAGDGEVAVEQASAILPGQTDLRFAGRLTAAGGLVDLRGQLDAVTDDLGALLNWLGLRPPAVASGRLRTLSVSSVLTIDGDTLQLSQTEIRVDATQLRGSAMLALNGNADDARPRLALDLVLDRLNVDAYQADLLPTDAARLLQQALRDADADIAVRLERLTWRGLLMSDVALALRADAGHLQVSNASLEIEGEAEARLDGEVDLETGAFTWAAQAHATRIARLLRRLDFPAPLMLSRAPPLTLTLAAAGRSERFDLEAEIDDGSGRLATAGEAGWLDGRARYHLDVEIVHPDLNVLIRPLGARTAVGGDAPPTALTFSGKITGAVDQHTIAGSARLGAMSLTGLLALQPGEPRPRYDLQLSIAEPSSEVLISLLELAGFRPALLRDTPVLGNWPRQPLDLAWTSQFDGSLKLSAKGGLAGEVGELDVRLQDGTLFVDRASLQLLQGTLSTELTLDADRPLPFLAASLDLRAIDAAWLAGRLGLDPVLEGSMDLIAEATAAGSSPYDLLRTLIGRIELAMSEGRLVGDEIAPIREALIAASNDRDRQGHDQQELPLPDDPASREGPALPFSDLLARFSLDRGMASIEAVQLDAGDAAVTVDGVIDLLLWAVDMTVEVTAPDHPDEPIALQVVGPLKQPQMRLTVPPALRAATAAP